MRSAKQIGIVVFLMMFLSVSVRAEEAQKAICANMTIVKGLSDAIAASLPGIIKEENLTAAPDKTDFIVQSVIKEIQSRIKLDMDQLSKITDSLKKAIP